MFTLKTPAKINWFLSVLGKREDGYHDIASLMQCVSLYDSLSFEDSADIKIITDADIPAKENLVYRAAFLLKEMLSIKKGAAITLKKEIPLSAGLGGGSSDAACTITGLNKLWGLGLNEEAVINFGGMLGSDIPFFFKGPFASVSGKGEVVTQLKADTNNVILLVKPDIGVSAKWAYSKVSIVPRELTKCQNNIKLFAQALNRQDFKSISSMMKNDLEIPVIKKFKVIGEIKERLLLMGAVVSLMSGSGSTVFGVFDSRQKAERAEKSMRSSIRGVWSRVVETLI